MPEMQSLFRMQAKREDDKEKKRENTTKKKNYKLREHNREKNYKLVEEHNRKNICKLREHNKEKIFTNFEQIVSGCQISKLGSRYKFDPKDLPSNVQ